MKLWLRKVVVIKHIVQMERKVERQTEKKVGNQMIDNKMPLDVWDRRQLRIYGTWRNINRLDDERIKEELNHQGAYMQQKRQQDNNKDFGPKKIL